LDGDKLMRISLVTNDATQLFPIPDAVKIVGASRDSPNELLIVRRRNTQLMASIVSLPRKSVTDVSGLKSDSPAMNALVSSERVYDDVTILTKKVSVVTIVGPADRENVFLRRRDRGASQDWFKSRRKVSPITNPFH
jgi:hypothetical protein